MFRKEFLVLSLSAVFMFLLVALSSWWVGHMIRKDAAAIAEDTLPGLVDTGAATSIMQENWLRLHLVLAAPSPAERAELCRLVEANSNEPLWREYGQSIFDPEDRKNYEDLLKARTAYLQLRAEFCGLAVKDPPAGAKEFFASRLEPAYRDYIALSRKLFEYNAHIGRERASRVVVLARAAPFVLGGCGVVVFGFGVLFGLRGALSGLQFAALVGNQRKDKR